MNAPLPRSALVPGWVLPGDVTKDKYILPVSGGADSSALAILLHERYPHVPFELVFTDTMAEEDAAYDSLRRLEQYLGKSITRICPEKGLFQLIDEYKGFLPSASSRWCTRELKLIPFQKWLSGLSGVRKWMFVGIRADESSRVAFTIEDCETVMPFVELGMGRKDVFELLSRTIGVPSTYRTRTRSGCSVCPFQRKAEIVGLLQRSPAEFLRGAHYEKLCAADQVRYEPPVNLSEETGIADNWLNFPMPKQEFKGTKGGTLSLFATAGVFVAVEFFFDGWHSVDEFVWHRRLVSFSTTLNGIKRQVQGRYEHLLRTSEVYDMTPEQVRRQARFAIYFLEAPSDLLDIGKPHADSYTWQGDLAYKQVNHVTKWATRILNADALAQEAGAVETAPATSWTYEQASIAATCIQQVKADVGRVVASEWFEPEEPAEEEEIEEKYFPCPMCQI